jgi:pyroglutamyl-peptidase
MGVSSYGLRRELVVLLTGFVPFGDDKYNPSGECARALDGKPVDAVNDDGGGRAGMGGTGFIRVRFQNDSDSRDTATGPGAVATAIDTHRPDIVISMGQTPATEFHIEEQAHHVIRGDRGSNTGEFSTTKVSKSTLPIAEIAVAIKAAGGKASTSTNPGKYVCENVMYAILREQASPPAGIHILRAGFIHVPRLVMVGGELKNELYSNNTQGDAVTQEHINDCIFAAIRATVRHVRAHEYAMTGSEKKGQVSVKSMPAH